MISEKSVFSTFTFFTFFTRWYWHNYLSQMMTLAPTTTDVFVLIPLKVLKRLVRFRAIRKVENCLLIVDNESKIEIFTEILKAVNSARIRICHFKVPPFNLIILCLSGRSYFSIERLTKPKNATQRKQEDRRKRKRNNY